MANQTKREKRSMAFGELKHREGHDAFIEKLDKNGCAYGNIMALRLSVVKETVDKAVAVSEKNGEELQRVKAIARDTMGVASAAQKTAHETCEDSSKFKSEMQRQWNSLWLQIVFGVILGNSAVFGLVYFLIQWRVKP